MQNLQDAVATSWQRHQHVLLNLLQPLTQAGLDLHISNSWPLAVHLAHIQWVRLYWLQHVAPGSEAGLPNLFSQHEATWVAERNPKVIEAALQASSHKLIELVSHALQNQQNLQGPYSHPLHFLQHMLWHEAYHLGQMVLVLKQNGHPLSEEQGDQLIWDVLHA